MSKVISKKQFTTPVKQTIAGNSTNSSPLRNSSKLTSRKSSVSKSTTRITSCSSKTSIVDKSARAETPSLTAAHRLTPNKILIDNLLCGLITESSLDFGNLQRSDIHQLTEMPQESLKESKSGDELIDLREELRRKNILIEQLTKENVGLKKEIGEFLAITDKIQMNLEEERGSYEVRISALEQENKDLLAENRFYRDQNQRRFKHRSSMDQLPLANSVLLNEANRQKENCIEEGEMKGSYSTVNEKLVTFSVTKDELQGLTHNFQVEKNWIKENTPNTCRNLKNEEKTPKKELKRDTMKMSASPNKKSRTSLHSSRNSMISLQKVMGCDSESKIALETTSDKKVSMSISGKLKM